MKRTLVSVLTKIMIIIIIYTEANPPLGIRGERIEKNQGLRAEFEERNETGLQAVEKHICGDQVEKERLPRQLQDVQTRMFRSDPIRYRKRPYARTIAETADGMDRSAVSFREKWK
jgi:hypothetical protein